MRLRIGPILGLWLMSLTLAPVAWGRQVVVTSSTPFRSGPNKTFPSQSQVAAGTNAEVTGQTGGWLQLKLADGRTGYVFERNVRDVPDPTTTSTTLAAVTPPPPAPVADGAAAPAVVPTAPAGQPPIPDDLPSLKAEVTTLRAKIDSLNEALKTQRDADAANGAERAPDATPREGAVSLAIAALLVGLAFGWLFSRLVLRRSDRRQWNKLRF